MDKATITAQRKARKAKRKAIKAKGRDKEHARRQAEIKEFEATRQAFEATRQAFEIKRRLKEREFNLALQLRLQAGPSQPFESIVCPDTQKELCAFCKQPQIPRYLGDVHMIGCVSALRAKVVLLVFPNESWKISLEGFPPHSV